MTDTEAFVEISSRSAAELAEKYLALWNEPDADRRRRMIAELWTEDGRHILQPPQEIRAIAARPGLALLGDPRGPGIRGDRGSRGERVRALGRLRGTQLPGQRRRRTTRRRRQVPLGGGRQGRRGVCSRAELPRPRRGRPDRARLHLRRRLGGMGVALLGQQEAPSRRPGRNRRSRSKGHSGGASVGGYAAWDRTHQ